jgi:hypothetical protein
LGFCRIFVVAGLVLFLAGSIASATFFIAGWCLLAYLAYSSRCAPQFARALLLPRSNRLGHVHVLVLPRAIRSHTRTRRRLAAVQSRSWVTDHWTLGSNPAVPQRRCQEEEHRAIQVVCDLPCHNGMSQCRSWHGGFGNSKSIFASERAGAEDARVRAARAARARAMATGRVSLSRGVIPATSP